jgi:hypothetical protein
MSELLGQAILHYKILEKLGEPVCRQAGARLLPISSEYAVASGIGKNIF